MGKTKKIVLILCITFLLGNIFNEVFATINPDDYKPSAVTEADAQMLTDKVGVILGTIRNIGVITSVLVLMIIGVKYMMGSVEEKADYKKSMWPYVVGCIMVSSGTIIVSYIYDVIH